MNNNLHILQENKIRSNFLNNNFNERFIRRIHLLHIHNELKSFITKIEDEFEWNIVIDNISCNSDNDIVYYPNIYIDIMMILDEFYILKLREMISKKNKVIEKLRNQQSISKPRYILIIKELKLITSKTEDVTKIFNQHDIEIIYHE